MAHQNQLVAGVKIHWPYDHQSLTLQCLPAIHHGDALEEVLPQYGIPEPPLFFDREIGKILHERGSGDSDPVPPRAVTIVDFDPLHAKTG
jgi:hypothetical protein